MNAAKKVRLHKDLGAILKKLIKNLEVEVIEEHVSELGAESFFGSHSYYVTKPVFKDYKKLPKDIGLELHFNNLDIPASEMKHGVVCYPVITKGSGDGIVLAQKMKFSFTPSILTGEIELDFEKGKENLAMLVHLAYQYEEELKNKNVSVKSFYEKVVIPTLCLRLGKKFQIGNYNWTKPDIKTHFTIAHIFPKMKGSDKASILDLAFKAQRSIIDTDLYVEKEGTEYVFHPLTNHFRRLELRIEFSKDLQKFAKKEIKKLPIPMRAPKRDKESGEVTIVDVPFTLRHFKDCVFGERGRVNPYAKPKKTN